MILSLQSSAHHTTASPGSDAPCFNPVDGVTSMQTGNLNFKKPLYVGCWNVRTFMDIGSQSLTVHALNEYQIDIACLSETRLPAQGSRQIQVPGKNITYWIHHSGPLDSSGQRGVAFALSTRAQKALLSFKAIDSRIAVARFKSSPVNIAVVAVYAPTLNSDAEAKDIFYNKLQSCLNQLPKRDQLIVAGDWNAKVGSCDSSTRHVIGRYGLGTRCENGDRLINFADSNRLFLTNTKFQHPRKHLLTWYSNDGRTANQIDFILIRRRWLSCVQDSRTFRGAETGNSGGSDHMLVRAKLRFRLSVRPKQCPRKKYNVALLSSPTHQQNVSEAIHDRMQTPSNQSSTDNDIDSRWINLRDAVNTSLMQHIGTTKLLNKDWISQRTLTLSNAAREARLSGSRDYRVLRRQATRSARNDRNQYWSSMANQMENASNVGDYGKLFRLIRQASGLRNNPTDLLRSSTGEIISDVHDRLHRWVEHFDELLNRDPSSLNIPEEVHSPLYTANCEPPTLHEVEIIITKLKNGKSPGEDGIPAEVYKTCIDVLSQPLLQLFQSIWVNEHFPSDWSTSILIPLHKKGDKSICSNYRGISLIDVAAKIFSILLMNRFSKERDERTRPNQAGFRPGRGCIDQLHILRRLLEQRHRYQQPTVACFIDFRAAFDSVNRQSLWKIMELDGIPSKLIRLIQSYYSTTKARIRMYGEESSTFELSSGVRQGCPLSPILFNFAIDWIMRHATFGYCGIEAGRNLMITDLEFADDVVVFAKDQQSLQQLLDRISRYASLVGLQVNTTKTQILANNFTSLQSPIMIDGHPIDQVDCFKYLGSTILANGQAKNEISVRVDCARRAFMQMWSTLWKKTAIGIKTKLRVYQCAIRPVLLYGCETWPLRVCDLHRLEVFDHWCLRVIIGIRLLDRVRNEEIRRRCSNIVSIGKLAQERRLRWFGHVLRRSTDDLTKAIMFSTPYERWKCTRGGQLKMWTDTVRLDAECLGLHSLHGPRRWKLNWLEICENMAADRRAWAATIRDIQEAGSS